MGRWPGAAENARLSIIYAALGMAAVVFAVLANPVPNRIFFMASGLFAIIAEIYGFWALISGRKNDNILRRRIFCQSLLGILLASAVICVIWQK